MPAGPSTLRPAGVALVIVGPTPAVALAHLYADALDDHTQQSWPQTWSKFSTLACDNASFLLVAVPPRLVGVVAWSIYRDVSDAIWVITIFGVLSARLQVVRRFTGYHWSIDHRAMLRTC